MRPAAGGCTCGAARPAVTSVAATTLRCVTPPRTGGSPVTRSSVRFEPGEDWFWDYQDNQYYDGPRLAPPESRPVDETVPGPRGRVPSDWAEILRSRAD